MTPDPLDALIAKWRLNAGPRQIVGSVADTYRECADQLEAEVSRLRAPVPQIEKDQDDLTRVDKGTLCDRLDLPRRPTERMSPDG